MGNQTISIITWYPTQSHEHDTEITSPCPIPIMPSARARKRQVSILEITGLTSKTMGSNRRYPARETTALPILHHCPKLRVTRWRWHKTHSRYFGTKSSTSDPHQIKRRSNVGLLIGGPARPFSWLCQVGDTAVVHYAITDRELKPPGYHMEIKVSIVRWFFKSLNYYEINISDW